MRNFRVGITSFLATLLVAFLAGCGQEVVTIPAMVSTTPTQGATSVAINTAITATFSMAMNPATLSASTFTVTGPGGTAIAGTIAYSGTTATFTPSAALAYDSLYTATITTGAKNLAGTSMLAAYTWSFTTATLQPTVIPPTVTAVVPLNGATNVSVGQVLSATFNEAMNPTTLNAASFTVTGPGGVSIPGTVTYSGVVATFTPTADLTNSTLYTATITTDATSLAGTPLATAYVWSFTTISPTSPTPTVTVTVPVNNATAVPISQVLSATFNEAMNCATLTSTTFTVTGPGTTAVAGTVGCTGSVATFTPSAALTVNTLYTATITTGAQDLVGTAMASNYAWKFLTVPAPTPPTVISTVPTNEATAVSINEALTATLSVAMNAATIDTTTFTLSTQGGAAVTGVVTYTAAGSVAMFTPNASLTASTVYTATITTGVEDLNGTAMASNYVWTFTTAAAPVVLPTVISTIPANLATNVPFNQVISATFSKAMTPSTISSATFTLTGPGTTAVSGLVAYAAISNTLTFIPTANLTASTLYTATITTGVTDLAGNAMASNYVWTFTTGSAPDVTAPELVSTVPANSAIDVPINQAVSATFTEAMNSLTITTATFTLTGPSGAAIQGTVHYDAVNFIATFTPTASLTASSEYTATVTNGATDQAGNPLGTNAVWNPWKFTTGTTAITPPVVLGPTVSLFGGFGGGAGMTNQGTNTVIKGNIGTTGASSLMTGFHDTSVVTGGVYECKYTETPLNQGLVNGFIDTDAGSSQPTVACPNEGTAATFHTATVAASQALDAYNTLAAIPNGLDVSVCPGCGGGNAGELGNRTLAAGTYKSSVGSYGITAGDLTLDAKGDPNAYWVFQMSTSLTVGTPSASQSVNLVNGAKASNVFWQVGSAATINYGGGGTMAGTVISYSGITISSPGVAATTTVNGRVLALNASVTMVNTVINVP